MASGAGIEELNGVRSCLSRFKAGGLLRAMTAGRGVGLIISDVVGDPLSVIASGPTVATTSDLRRALATLDARLTPEAIPSSIRRWLERSLDLPQEPAGPTIPFRNIIIGNNQTAVSAAAAEARRRGYQVVREATNERGIARDVGVAMAEEFLRHYREPCPGRGWCVISGGEPVVHLVPTDQPRRGGRNQELILAAAARLWHESPIAGALLSGERTARTARPTPRGPGSTRRSKRGGMTWGSLPVRTWRSITPIRFLRPRAGC
jgi:glycerate 2-kinase